jgi:hypothetical protein
VGQTAPRRGDTQVEWHVAVWTIRNNLH